MRLLLVIVSMLSLKVRNVGKYEHSESKCRAGLNTITKTGLVLVLVNHKCDRPVQSLCH
jgi:hypothetical protein